MKNVFTLCILNIMLLVACNNEEAPQPIQPQGYNMLLIGNSFFKPYAEHLNNLATEANLNDHSSTLVNRGG